MKKNHVGYVYVGLLFFVVGFVVVRNSIIKHNSAVPNEGTISSIDGTADGLKLATASQLQMSKTFDAIDFDYAHRDDVHANYIAEYGYDEDEFLLSGASVDPYKGALPNEYEASANGARDAFGYPIRSNYLSDGSSKSEKVARSPFMAKIAKAQETVLPDTFYTQDAEIVGLYHCKEAEDDTSFFSAYFEDDALYADGESGPFGFADLVTGDIKKIAACDVLREFDEILMLDEFDRNPDVIFYAVDEMPSNLLTHGSSYFLDFSDGFSHSFLHDYIVAGSDKTPGVGNFDGFVRVNHNIPWTY